MKLVEQTGARLVLRQKPWFVWLVGGLFLAAGTAVAMTSEAGVFGVLFAVAGGAFILLFGNTVTVTFDRGAGRFTRAVKGWLRKSEAAHPLADIADVHVETDAAGDAPGACRVAVTMTSGTCVPLTPLYDGGVRDKEQIAGVIRQFLDLQPG